MSLLAVGTVAFDCVETPFGKHDDIIGGSVSYLGTSASYFTDVRMMSVIGEDFPEDTLEFFRSRKINTDGVKRLPGKTFRWRGKYTDNLNEAETLDTQLNVLTEFDPRVPEEFKNSDYLVLGNISPDLQLNVLNQVPNAKLVACDTMNFWISGALEDLKKTLKKVNLLSINDGEARMLSGEHNLVHAAKAIRAMGPDILIIKRGEHGALAVTEEGMFSAPAMPLDVIKDPTGAGDSFAGGLMGYIARKGSWDLESLRQGVILGSVMASYNVQDFSLERLKTLTQEDINSRYQAFANLTRFSSTLDIL
ncbi:MAG: sugar kinase [Deltaproteobacteria bacterium]|jgi:sugar/nucleoside kinase (ribokinase family)|nr:sugar kinase [Deltaproteobacteria bacterium]MBT6433763.1 sugar kinase [Deltaproteobacteria bacterium]MBT6489442.1 sugar kinase [Deltaproteobacteria bacterium]